MTFQNYIFDALVFIAWWTINSMLSLLAFERIAKKYGVKRISREALEETREVIEELGLELAEKAVKASRFAGRKTLMEEDIKFVTEKRE